MEEDTAILEKHFLPSVPFTGQENICLGVSGLSEGVLGESVLQLPVTAVRPGRFQPRRRFDDEGLEELADSIRAHGVIQPLIVRPVQDGYELVAGERRWRAARLAGLERVPAVLRPLEDKEAACLSLIENVQRQSLHFLEEAEGYARLIADFDMIQQGLAKQVGISQSSLANKLRLLKLSGEVRAIISRENIGERHARALLKLPRSDQQLEVLERVVARGLTVRETEKVIERMLAAPRPGLKADDAMRRGRLVGAVRDIRIFLNSFRQAVEALRTAGVDVEMDEVPHEESLEIRVRILKNNEKMASR